AGKSSPHRVVGDVKRVATAPSPVIPKSQSRAPQPQPGQHRPGPGAPGAVPHEHGKGDDLEGMVVEVEVIQWPSATQSPRGRVVEVLGREDDFGVDVEIIIRKHHIRHVFPQAVLEEAQEFNATIPHRELERRNDYRNLPIVTIDGETARDFHDAVLVNHLANGNYEPHVDIPYVA